MSEGSRSQTTTHSDFVPGNMDISHHEKTWSLFWVGTKYSMTIVTAIMILLAIFRTNG